MALEQHEIISLLLEVVITGGIIVFLYLSSVLLLIEFLGLSMGIFGQPNLTAYEYFGWTPEGLQLARNILFLLMMGIGIIAIIYRLRKRLETIRLAHILEYLKYISKGNYDLRIPEVEIGNLTEVVRSINTLVESTVRAMEEERKIEKTKDELIANVGHDLRTPLTSIVGYLGLIENEQYHTQDQLLTYTHTAYTKALSMQNLVNDLFDYAASRLTSYEVKPILIELDFFFQQIAADFEMAASEKNITINVHVQPDHLMASLDPEKMARVMNNLITNALKYGHGATDIHLVAYVGSDNQRIIEVRNNGALIQEEELEKIFQRSYRADPSRNADVPGTGLGLAIVRNIVELHHGRVYALIDNSEMVFRMELELLEEHYH